MAWNPISYYEQLGRNSSFFFISLTSSVCKILSLSAVILSSVFWQLGLFHIGLGVASAWNAGSCCGGSASRRSCVKYLKCSCLLCAFMSVHAWNLQTYAHKICSYVLLFCARPNAHFRMSITFLVYICYMHLNAFFSVFVNEPSAVWNLDYTISFLYFLDGTVTPKLENRSPVATLYL